MKKLIYLLCLTLTACGGGGGDKDSSVDVCTSLRIAGGESCSTIPSSVVLVQTPIGNGLAEVCTGTFISTTKVLTAAHCFTGAHGIPEILGTSFSAESSGVSIHPLYDGSTVSAFDIAVLSFAGPLPVTPAPLIRSKSVDDAGELLLIYGFGLDESNQSVIDRINSGDDPLKATEARLVGVQDGVLVVTSDGHGSACSGDSGGPVLAQSGSGSFGIAGIVGAGPADGCSDTKGRNIAAPSLQSSGAVSFIDSHVPGVTVN